MKDIRGQAEREAEWLAGNGPQACIVCGRLFVRRKDNVCSISCLYRAAQRYEKSKEPDER
ncbi:MAG: hypothetical protein WCD69_21060 [Xanthobacteraceae bacterium]